MMDPMNSAIRRQGNRSRMMLPDIGQGQMDQSVPSSAPSTPQGPASPSATTGPALMTGDTPTSAPATATPNPFDLHPPGTPANPSHYNYEPQPGGAWTVYPPGVPAPDGSYTTSMPRAASTADYARMSRALGQALAPQANRPPGL